MGAVVPFHKDERFKRCLDTRPLVWSCLKCQSDAFEIVKNRRGIYAKCLDCGTAVNNIEIKEK